MARRFNRPTCPQIYTAQQSGVFFGPAGRSRTYWYGFTDRCISRSATAGNVQYTQYSTLRPVATITTTL